MPITYERLPSLCYWCGKLEHSFKGCDDFHEQVTTGYEITTMKFPYREWLKLFPMKHAQIVPEKGREYNDNLPKSLFRYHHEAGTTGERKEENIQFDISADILHALEKVKVNELNIPQ